MFRSYNEQSLIEFGIKHNLKVTVTYTLSLHNFVLGIVYDKEPLSELSAGPGPIPHSWVDVPVLFECLAS